MNRTPRIIVDYDRRPVIEWAAARPESPDRSHRRLGDECGTVAPTADPLSSF